MTDAVAISLITAAASTIAAVLGAISVIYVAKTRTDMTRLEKNTNSKMDELVRVTAQAEFAKGLKQGVGETLAGATGETGATGPTGATGERGPSGPRGMPG